MTRQHSNRAFTLVELIIAIFILGIGMISIASLFPAGIKQQEIAEDDVYGPLVARHAMELLRTRLKQEDFGCFEDFSSDTLTVRDPIPINAAASQYISGTAYAPTIAKDWIWKRPGFVTVDDDRTYDRDEAGMYDIFSYYGTRRNTSRSYPDPVPFMISSATLSDVSIASTGNHRLYGIPYNRKIYDQQFNVALPNYAWTFADSSIPKSGAAPSGRTNVGNALREPAVFITQRERYWPMPANAVGVTPTPRYVWDCMFRRFNGRILVGMFVYRVIPANGLRGGNYELINNQKIGTPYVSVQVTPAIDTADNLIPSSIGNYPPIPQLVSSRSQMANLSRGSGDGANYVWGAGGLDKKVGSSFNTSKYSPFRDDCAVPGTGPSPTDPPTALKYSETWQLPGQWMIDQYNNVHHVIEGRRTHDDGPVILAKPVPRQPYSNSLFDSTNRSTTSGTQVEAKLATPGSGGDSEFGIQDLWFVPPYDANGNQLLPVYACVEEL